MIALTAESTHNKREVSNLFDNIVWQIIDLLV